MEVPINEIVTGRKCFFILPDPSLMPVAFLEDFFALGFECYYIGNDGRVPVQKKIETILKLFKDVIFFVNIDYEIYDLHWSAYIKELIEAKKATPEQFGIVFLKRQSSVELETISNIYFKELGLKLGYVQLEYQKKNNLEIVAKALFAIHAQGRRKTIRALCSSACTYKFDYERESFSGSLQDISLSHFSILVKDAPLPVKLYEKIYDIHFNVRGSFFHSNAILAMQRTIGTANLYVFAFVTPSGASGLDERTKSLLVPVLYSMISTVCLGLLEKHYRDEEKKEPDKPLDLSAPAKPAEASEQAPEGEAQSTETEAEAQPAEADAQPEEAEAAEIQPAGEEAPEAVEEVQDAEEAPEAKENE